MRTHRTAFIIALPLLAALGLAACGSTSTSGNNAGNGGVYGTTTTSPTSAPAATDTPATVADGMPIKIASANVAAVNTKILTTSQGMTLYYNKSDSGTSVFSGSAWPALVSSSGAPTSSASLPGKLSVLSDVNGKQVTYNGHPLYVFSGDSAPGDVNGEGIGNVWFVATPSLAQASSSSPTPGATPTSTGGYGYGH